MTQNSTLSTPRPVKHRALAPDLARGFMLLVIAVVHAHGFRSYTTGGATAPGTADQVATAAVALLAENRGYPMFAALFGYGLAQIHRHRVAEGAEWPSIRRLLRRRGWWLVAIGLAHTALLFYGDVIAVYGTIALLFVAAPRFADRTLLIMTGCTVAVGSVLYVVLSNAFVAAAGDEAIMNPILDGLVRLVITPMFIPLLITISLPPFLVGIWAARRRLLEEPERHLGLLRRVAGGGIMISLLGALPHMLVAIGTWQPSTSIATSMFWVHLVTGYAGAFGYAATIALVANHVRTRPGPVVTALAATGRRSMTCYLFQSVVWAVLIPPYALHLGARLTDTQAVGLGVAVWLATVVGSDLQRRAGFQQGPTEWFLRRMTYGRVQRVGPGPDAGRPLRR